MRLTKRTVRAAVPVCRLALLLPGALAAGQAQSYAEHGYYIGAYATALEYGVRGQNNFATATSDISKASVARQSYFPGGASNSPESAVNFLDTITVTCALPAPV